MERINFWDSKIYKDNFEYCVDINEIVKLIESGKLISFHLKDSYKAGDMINYPWEENLDENKEIIYTDKNHPFLFAKKYFVSVMNKEFFNLHKKEIIDAYIRYFKECKEYYGDIPNFLFTDEILDVLLQKKGITLNLVDVYLTKEQIDKIREHHIDAYVKYNDEKIQVSSRFVLFGNTIDDLKDSDRLLINSGSLKKVNKDNLQYLKSNATLELIVSNIQNDERSLEETYKNLSEIVVELDKLGNNNTIIVPVSKRSLFNKYFKNLNLKNAKIIVRNDSYDYSFEEYLEEEKKLDKLVEPIVNSNLSPLERYFAVYNIVKNYKKYKESDDKMVVKARDLRYILNNEYIVCVGFVKLLEILLDKVGINSNKLDVEVDISYDKGFTVEEKSVVMGQHVRLMASIDDDKYGVHGLYVSDPTWDNNLSKNYLNHALMTADKATISSRMFKYNKMKFNLDIHSFSDFNKIVNFELKRILSSKKGNIKKEHILNAYAEVCSDILDGVRCDPKYSNYSYALSQCKDEESYVYFLTSLGHYLLTRINQPIAYQTIINACMVADKTIKGIDDDYEEMEREFLEREDKYFPYELGDLESHNLKSVSK